MKKALIVSPFFFPELISTGKYNTDLALQMHKLNIEIEVLCSHPLYPDWRPQKSNQMIEGLEIVRGGSWLRYPKNPMLRRLVLELWFFFFTITNIRKLRSSDAIVAILPPSCFMLATYLLSSKTKIIGIIHDLQTIHLDANGSKLKKFLLKLIKAVEGVGFSKCDKLIYLSMEMQREASIEYKLDKAKSQIVYPPITIDDFACRGELDEYLDKKYVNVVYSGALGEKQNPQGIYDIASHLTKLNHNIRFIFFSRGPHFMRLKELNKNQQIIFNDLVESKNLGELLTRSDIQIVPQASGTSKGSLPSKVPNILASGSIIYTITDKNSELQELLSKQKGCVISNTWDINENVDLLNSLINRLPKKFDRSNDLDLYERDFLAKIISNMINKV